jgi:hypothetical protein
MVLDVYLARSVFLIQECQFHKHENDSKIQNTNYEHYNMTRERSFKCHFSYCGKKHAAVSIQSSDFQNLGPQL